MKRWAKRIGITVVGLAVVLGAAVAGVFGFTSSRMHRHYEITPEPVAVPTDAASVTRGRHIVEAVTKCIDCHGDDLGGKVFIDDPMMGRLSASNLTRGRGGVGTRYTNVDYVRAIRHGVRPDGTPLLFMPSQEFTNLSDEDLGAVLAYVRSLPAVDHELPPNRIKLLPRVLLVTRKLDLLPVELIDHTPHPRTAPPVGPTAAYGRYLAEVGGCFGCHGKKLHGGPIPGSPPDWPPAADLTPAGELARWSEADFAKALSTGVRPDGRQLNPVMPWPYTARLTPDEVRALWEYLRTVPSAP